MGDGICSLISMAPVPKKLLTHRLGRTMLLTPHLDWTAEQVVAAYAGQQRIEQVFRGLKDGDWLGWDRCITGPIARSLFTLSIAWWASRCSSTCTNKLKLLGQDYPSSRCSTNCGRSSNLFCSIRHKAKKVRSESLSCNPNKLFRNNNSPGSSVWMNLQGPQT